MFIFRTSIFFSKFHYPLSLFPRQQTILLEISVEVYPATINPLDTGRKFSVHMTLRRSPRCLVNALCSFNLHSVSRRNVTKEFLLIFKKLSTMTFFLISELTHLTPQEVWNISFGRKPGSNILLIPLYKDLPW